MAQHKSADTEPTMEEILASIRRIISEDGDGEPAQAEEAAEEAVVEIEAEAEAQEDVEAAAEADDVIELTEMLPEEEPAAAESEFETGELAGADESDLVLVDDEGQDEMQDEENGSEGLLSQSTLAQASMAFGSLAPDARIAEPGGTGSLEAIVRELIRPMLREWLEDNLPGIVEEMVEKEVRRVSSMRRRRR